MGASSDRKSRMIISHHSTAIRSNDYHRMMKIALDATPLTVPSGGVRRYTEELSRALAQSFPEDEFWLLSDQQFDLPVPAFAHLKAGHGPRTMIERRWWL